MSKNPTPKMDALRAMREQRFARDASASTKAAAPAPKAAVAGKPEKAGAKAVKKTVKKAAKSG